MFVIKRINDESLIQHFKFNIITHTYDLKFDFRPRNIGLYSKINWNLIIIKNVSEEEEHGGPVFMHFYGVIFRKKYLLGIICPQMLYTIFTFGLLFIREEYIYFKIIALAIWVYIYLSNINSIRYIYDKIVIWMK